MQKTNLFNYSITFVSLSICLLLFTSIAPVNNGLTEDILKHTNKFRKSKGLSALVIRNDLNAIAAKHSEDMDKGRKGFGHDGFKQREVQVKKIIKPYSGMAENVAYGARNGKEAVDVWKNSSAHKKNMLGNYKYIGIGTARNQRGIIYYTEIFVK